MVNYWIPFLQAGGSGVYFTAASPGKRWRTGAAFFICGPMANPSSARGNLPRDCRPDASDCQDL